MDDIMKCSIAMGKILDHLESIDFEDENNKKLLKRCLKKISISIDSLDELYWELGNNLATDFKD